MDGKKAYVLSKNYTDSVALSGVPIMQPQINPTTRNWEIFNPTSSTYIDTGVLARGVSPRIGSNGNWEVWNDATSAFVDSGIKADWSSDVQSAQQAADNAQTTADGKADATT
jgi:hypothetical protein